MADKQEVKCKEPRALRIISPKTGKDGYQVEEEAICEILNHPDVIDTPVIVISIAGAMREGKSFLLSLLIAYLESGMSSNWLNNDEQTLQRHFKWTSGRDRETMGIYMWSKPYVTKSSNLKVKVAILLMDTQGSFDRDGEKCASDIFCFSTLLSSIQLYNICNNINENHLQPLSVFADCAKQLVKSRSPNVQKQEAPYQTIMFVIRDWQVDGNKFQIGLEDGQKYIDQQFSINPKEKRDVIAVRKSINEAFQKIRCCLFPYPGGLIAVESDDEDDQDDDDNDNDNDNDNAAIDEGHAVLPENCAKMKNLTENFKKILGKFACDLFKPKDSSIKKINGQQLTGRKLLNFIAQYHHLLEQGSITKPVTVLENLSHKDYLPKADLDNMHLDTKKELIAEYEERIPNYCKKLYFDKMDSEMENAYSTHAQTRIRKEAKLRKQYVSLIRKTSKKYKPNKVKLQKGESMEEAKLQFEQEAPKSPLYDEYEQSLITNLEKCFQERISIEQIMEEIRNTAAGMYMNMIVQEAKMAKELNLEMIQKRCKEHVIASFRQESKINKIKSYYNNANVTDDQIRAQIDEKFVEITAEYQTDEKTLCLVKYDAHCEEVKDKYIKYMWEATDNVYTTSSVLKSIHDKYLEVLKTHHDTFIKSPEDKIWAEDEINALQEEYQKIASNIQKRQNVFREASYFVVNSVEKSLASLTFSCGGWVE
ncbi:unnamed protein product [Clavelina lepadiformis]|uniref:GB1/RHD3-type G domain-containing protein n=1 Tax=Clavelina lepadiformis TaxID=159417 RepID=A0ABP0H2D4_CLALP